MCFNFIYKLKKKHFATIFTVDSNSSTNLTVETKMNYFCSDDATTSLQAGGGKSKLFGAVGTACELNAICSPP